ncbi:hypothetical protein [Clostridium sp. YIM B02555]|uniref:hypothetical protein n=1 Tax=Clostridium sp. YIM B02555 TaxID=2911968 RepID=UPI001EECFCAC|nr:hypothetical protein [Clostridium sp. YIM B02555]
MIYNMLTNTKAVEKLDRISLTGKFPTDFFMDLDEFIITCETNVEFCFKNNEMEKYRQDMCMFLKNFFYIAVCSQYDYSTGKSYIQKELDNYSEICNSLDSNRAKFIYSYTMLIQKGIKLGYI